MNRILFISDLHLSDIRHEPGRDSDLLTRLASLIRRRDYKAVLNLGDTVSRKAFLPEGTDPRRVFRAYREWRDSLGIPFRECTIFRERPFFRDIFGQDEDSVWNGLPGTVVLTFSPDSADDHEASGDQWNWLSEQARNAAGSTLVVCSHVPYPGSCSRPESPGIYLPVPEPLRRLLENRETPVFWAGGHFHWKEEPPVVKGSLTAFMGGRFTSGKSADQGGYLRELDLDSLELNTLRDW